MAQKKYDITLKDLVEHYPDAWPVFTGAWKSRGVDVVDADVSTLTAAADKVLRVHGESYSWLLNLELQADHDLGLPERMLYKAVALRKRHGLQVRSVIVLLRRQANTSDLTGVLDLQFEDDADAYVLFRYHVLQLWQLPLEPLLSGSVGILPLAPLVDSATDKLPQVLSKIDERLRQEVSLEEAERLRWATYLLMGLRYDSETTDQFKQGVFSMVLESSSTYKSIKAEGIAEGETKGRLGEGREILLRLGSIKFGPPNEETRQMLESISDLNCLEALAEKLLQVSSWQELFAE